MPAAGLAEVLARFGPAYLAQHRLSATQAKAWRAIAACRTEALGGHLESCDRCGRSRHVYHSCRNRHCPRCQMRAKEAWLAARRREVLPVPYFHLVFTLPHAVNGLIAAAPRRLYETLFGAVAATLSEFAGSRRHLGGEPAFSLVLHTWKQDLGRHVHLHALVAGGRPGAQRRVDRGEEGFPVSGARALEGIPRQVRRRTRDTCAPPAGCPRTSPRNPSGSGCVAASTPTTGWSMPKQPLGGPEAVLDYLGRYTHRVAISNERILGIDGNEVLLRVRADGKSGRKRTLRLAGTDFIERFLQHVLPCGFKRIRHYGLLAPAHKRTHLAAARAALGAPSPQPALIESVAAFLRRVSHIETARCPHCSSGQFRVVAVIRPKARLPDPRGPP